MKQHITVEQAKEAFDNLSETGYEQFAKGMTIGNMIEILQGKVLYFNMSNMYARTDGKEIGWGVFKPKTFDIRADELCDALWEAVKKYI
jgi:hypothetical protein